MEKQPAIYLGTEHKPSSAIRLKAGKLTAFYQDGTIRRVSAGGTEVLRMIYPAVRDHNWGTVPGKITNEEIKAENHSFSIFYECRYMDGDISYQAHVRISGNRDNILTFSMEGEALSWFRKNRIGLNVLHPIRECAGRVCRVLTPSGEEYESTFPVFISPNQPMKNIRSLAWDLEGGIQTYLEFSGEVFEMEDQRNWTDASYKTYCTPLALPYPVTMEKGVKLQQEISLKVAMKQGDEQPDRPCRIDIPEGKASFPFPAIGICRSSDFDFLHREDMKLIAEAGFDHYRLDLELYRPRWQETLGRGLEEAGNMGLPLELGLFFGEDHARELKNFMLETFPDDDRVARILVFTMDHLSDDGLSSTTIPLLRDRFKNARIGTGTNANFAELNRNQPNPEGLDFITWSISPQVHAFDPLSLVENLEGQRDTALSGRRMAGEIPVTVSPVTLRPKFNAVATGDEDMEVSEDKLPVRFDPRQASLFCAGWTLGSINYLAGAGTGSITYFETAGRGGIIHGRHEPFTPRLFPAKAGEIYPVYFLFRELLKFKNYRVNHAESSHPLLFSTLLFEDNQEQILCLANHTDSCLQIGWTEEKKIMQTWVLDEHTIGALRKGEDLWMSQADVAFIELNPYAVSIVKTSRSKP